MMDKIAVMNEGKIQQVDQPKVLYEKPKNSFVANFIGSANCLKGTVTKVDKDRAYVMLTDINQEIISTANNSFRVKDSVQAIIRPEKMKLQDINIADDNKENVNCVRGS